MSVKKFQTMTKAIGLLSGGLDSTLAVRLMLDQGITVICLNFITPFCTCTKKGCQNQAKEMAERFNIELKIIHLKEDYIELVKNPKYGYGKNLNPCIDCRIFMFSKARQYMVEVGAEFVFTGEVLGERPMSQNLRALKIIEKESGLNGRILRPLCARLLPPTIPEIEGIVNREKLLAIQGRSRRPQIALARERGIDEYPCPAGGCLLTDPNFGRRLKEAFEYDEDSLIAINLLKYGRHFRLKTGAKIIVGRNEAENKILKTIATQNNILFLELQDFPGPTALIFNHKNGSDIEQAASLCLAYSDYKGTAPATVKISNRDEILATPALKQNFATI